MNPKNVPAILDRHGNVMRSASPFFGVGHNTAHDAASRSSSELMSWNPQEYSADGALLTELKTLRGRNADAVRNNGFASGAVQLQLDNIIGTGLKLNVKPDWAALGIDDMKIRKTWERDTYSKFCSWAYDVNNVCDASQKKNFAQILAQGYRSYLTSFEIVATSEWKKNPLSKYKTCVQMIDPARLSQPEGYLESARFRAGIEMDEYGAPLAHWFSSIVGQYETWDNGIKTWKRVPTFTNWGRRQVFHIFEQEMPGQTRGKGGIVSVLAKMKMLEKFEAATLQASILNAMYAATIESSFDWHAVGEALGNVDSDSSPLAKFMQSIGQWDKEGGAIRFNGVKIPHLHPGEKLNFTQSEHPTAQFNMFEEAVLRYLAAGTNLTYEQISRDYSKTNYSSARAGMLEAWRFFSGRHAYIAAPFATYIYCNWLEEAFDKGEVEQIAGTPDYYEAKSAWCGCTWTGPGRGHIDPDKEWSARKTQYGMGLGTLEEFAAEDGKDWREIIDQRKEEAEYMRENGMDPDAIMASAQALKVVPEELANSQKTPTTNPKGGGNDNPTDENSGQATARAIAESHDKLISAISGQKPVQVNTYPQQGTDKGTIQLIEGLRSDMRNEISSVVDNLAAHFDKKITEAISQPSIPVYDAKGNFIGVKKISQAEFDRLQHSKGV